MKILKKCSITLVALASLLFCGCASNQEILLDKNTPQATCLVGDCVQIILAQNPTTGYVWKVAKDGSPVLKLESQMYQPDAQTAGLCGAGGTILYTFKAVESGEAKVVLEHLRPWENKPIDTKTFTISAR